MIGALLTKVFGTRNERLLRKLRPIVERVNALEPEFERLSEGELRGKTGEFRDRLAGGESLDALLPEAFAAVREASKRTLGLRHFDVQVLGGIVLHQGRIAEMKTGEGKTLVATLPVYLNALAGKGVHVVTVNDYLAERDSLGRGNFKGMANVYGYLGLTCGVIKHGLSYEERKRAYACDITYATNNELGFDYLRDNMATHPDMLVQRGLHYAIVDEVDSILIDEARTPLIISGPTEESTELYYRIDRIIPSLKRGVDYDLEEKHKAVFLTEAGVGHVEKLLGVENLYDHRNVHLVHHVNQALKAHVIFHRDVDYIVKDGKVVIVDEFTGRLMPGRRYSDGLHQALEAKERVHIEQESQTYATITFQNFFRMYTKLAGMTGTAETESAEFHSIYGLDVTVIPTNRPMVRVDEGDAVYRTESEKFKAIVEDIAERHGRGQPVLVGTVSIEKSEKLSALLTKRGIRHEVLNAKHHEREAEIVAQAGQPGAVTIATNMAGRGTDIVLGPGVKECGGLAVIGSERHESRRIDNQLRGRSGRQGDPGSSRFYVSLEDDLMRIFGSDRLKGLMTRLGMQEDEEISHPWVTRAIERAQKTVEAHNFDIRKHLLEYDDVLNKQREVIYRERQRVLRRENLRDHFLEIMDDVAVVAVDRYAPEKTRSDEWDLEGLEKWFQGLTGFPLRWGSGDMHRMDREALHRALKDALAGAHREKEESLGADVLRMLERAVLLQVVDQQWKDHLYGMDRLKEGIGLQAYGHKDPLIEYKREGFHMFQDMVARIKEETLRLLYHVQTAPLAGGAFSGVQPSRVREEHPEFDRESVFRPARPGVAVSAAGEPPPGSESASLAGMAPSASLPRGGEPVRREPLRRSQPKVGRNEPCPCGSGKKYKKCHGR